MTVEVIIQTADEYGTLDMCMSYFGLPIDTSSRITVISSSSDLRARLFTCLCRALDHYTRGGCNGISRGGTIGGCRAHSGVGTQQLAVVAVDPASSPTHQLEKTLEEFLVQPTASALGVLPLGLSTASLPAAAMPYQAVWYDQGVCGAVDDVLNAAGVEPEERRAFISYSRADIDQAAQLVEVLSLERFQVYLDTRSNTPASLWEEVLRDALVDAALVVVLETANSADSDWVKREIGMAYARGAGVIAVQPGPAFPFTCVATRFVGPVRDAGPFVAKQHRLLVSTQRAVRVRAVGDALTALGVQARVDGGSVRTPTHLIGVYPRPVTLRQLRRTVTTADNEGLAPITYSPIPVLGAKRADRRWIHDTSHTPALSDGSLRSLVRRVTTP